MATMTIVWKIPAWVGDLDDMTDDDLIEAIGQVGREDRDTLAEMLEEAEVTVKR